MGEKEKQRFFSFRSGICFYWVFVVVALAFICLVAYLALFCSMGDEIGMRGEYEEAEFGYMM